MSRQAGVAWVLNALKVLLAELRPKVPASTEFCDGREDEQSWELSSPSP